MKKNKMMRLASVMLVLTMLTTCAISGTFAKYTSAADATDSARVAKWGVSVNASGTLFGANYEAKANGNEIAAEAKYSADSNDTKNIVAPGTQNTTGMTFTVVGEPEVANSVTITQVESSKFEDIYLVEGYYAVLVKAQGVTADNYANYYVENAGSYTKASGFVGGTTYYELRDKATVSGATYYPVVWKIDGSDATAKTTADLFTEFAGEFSGITAATNNANVDIAASHKLTWEWPFEGINDGADTILGNLMAAGDNYVVVKSADDTYATCSKLVVKDDYNLNVYFDAKITVTQVD